LAPLRLDWLLLQAFRHGSYSVVGAETLEKSVAEAGEMAVFIIIATGSLRVSVLHSFQPLLLDWWLYSRHGGLSCLIMEAHSSARKSLPPAAGDDVVLLLSFSALPHVHAPTFRRLWLFDSLQLFSSSLFRPLFSQQNLHSFYHLQHCGLFCCLLLLDVLTACCFSWLLLCREWQWAARSSLDHSFRNT